MIMLTTTDDDKHEEEQIHDTNHDDDGAYAGNADDDAAAANDANDDDDNDDEDDHHHKTNNSSYMPAAMPVRPQLRHFGHDPFGNDNIWDSFVVKISRYSETTKSSLARLFSDSPMETQDSICHLFVISYGSAHSNRTRH